MRGKGKTAIVVTGRAGSGKSLLICRMRGLAEDLQWSPPGQSRTVETAVIDVGSWARIVRIVPGQSASERDLGIHEAFSEHDQLEGVIQVVDWGFTAERDSALRTELIASGRDSVGKIRKYNLEQEIEEFRLVCGRIAESCARVKRPRWLLIAVNKADLFREGLDAARQYYQPEFSAPLNTLLQRVGTANLRYRIVPVSSWDADFGWNGEVVYSRSGGSEASRALMRNFIQILSEMSDAR